MTKTFLDNLEEKIFSRVKNEEELTNLLKKLSDNPEKIKAALDYYTIYKQKEKWLLTKMRKDNEVLIVKNVNSIEECIININRINQQGTYKKTLIYLNNIDYPDIDKLNELAIPFYIVINDTLYNIEEYKEMRETINYYKSLVKDLSPLEQVTYIYDLIKSFEYKETNNKEESRYIKHIIQTGNIVCVGYANFICQILQELGFKCYIVDLKNINNNGHERFIVKIQDEKYNINSIFAMDATFDSASNISLCIDEKDRKVYRSKNNPIKAKDKIIKKYDNLVLYKYFLVPLIEYGLIFKDEQINSIKEFSSNQILGDENYYKELQTKHVNSRNIDLNLFIKLMYNVKIAEGYDADSIIQLINDIILVNGFSTQNKLNTINEIISQMNNNQK